MEAGGGGERSFSTDLGGGVVSNTDIAHLYGTLLKETPREAVDGEEEAGEAGPTP